MLNIINANRLTVSCGKLPRMQNSAAIMVCGSANVVDWSTGGVGQYQEDESLTRTNRAHEERGFYSPSETAPTEVPHHSLNVDSGRVRITKPPKFTIAETS